MINLNKGGRINLSKDESGNKLNTIFFGANWGAIQHSGFLGFGEKTEAVDLDASAIMLDANKKEFDTVYYAHKTSKDYSIHHSGDDLVGDTDGDDGMDNEVIQVDLNKVDTRVQSIAFVLNSYRHHKFNKIPYMGLRIYTTSNNKPVNNPNQTPNILAKYNLENESNDPETTFKGKEGIVLGFAYRKDGEWKFKACGNTGEWRSINDIKKALIDII